VLGDRLRVEVLPCLGRLLQEAPAVGAAGVAVLAGGIAYGAEAGETPALPALPGTVAELEAVAGHLRTLADVRVESLTGAAATKAAFVSAVPRARFVHVATHGYALGQGGEDEVAGLLPLASCGLAFAGVTRANGTLAPPESLLTAEELAGLDLTRAELVVLSACDTRVGLRRAGQALQSLETALAIAGARASLTSVWPVDDAAAQGLMAEFYRRLVAPGETPSTALWEAKRSLRSKGAPLADWAGWTLSGTVGQR
jgi:CHAT domain-containing protein